MMEYGILSLVAIALAAAGACVHLAAQLKGEFRTIDLIRVDLAEAKRLATEANERSAKIETDHYHQLRRQLGDMGEDFKSYKSEYSKTANQLVALQGMVGKLRQQINAADKGEKPPEGGGEDDVVLPPAISQIPKTDIRTIPFGSRRRAA